MLQADAVAKSYRRGSRYVAALREVSLEVRAGEFAGLWGPGRSGKTTLLRVLTALETPNGGRVVYQGRELHELSADELADYRLSQIGCVWTTWPRIPGYSVVEYVGLPLLGRGLGRARSRARAREVLERVGASDCAEARLTQVSDAERLRVALAHALIREPRVLLVDEPMANLDPIERAPILELLTGEARERGRAVLATATHALDLRGATPMYTLTGGRLLGSARQCPGELVDFPARTAGRDDGR